MSTPALSGRSRTGCLTCKTRRKKCDETRPKCQRCQRSGLECLGYPYIDDKTRVKQPPIRPAPITIPSVAPATTAERTLSSYTTLSHNALWSIHRQDTPYDSQAKAACDIPDDVPDLSFLSSSSPTALLGHPEAAARDSSRGASIATTSTDTRNLTPTAAQEVAPMVDQLLPDYWLSSEATDSVAWRQPLIPAISASTISMGSGQNSLFQTPLNPVQPQDTHTTNPTKTSVWGSSEPTGSLSGVESEEGESTTSDEDPEGISVSLCRVLPLDKTVESNALPFVLQNYASWITRIAFEPLKMLRVARNFVSQYFVDTQDSREMIILLANVAGRVGYKREGLTGEFILMLSQLEDQVRRRLLALSSDLEIAEETDEYLKALDACLETISIDFYSRPILHVLSLLSDAAPIFRRLCPDGPIHLPSLLIQPLVGLRKFAYVDIFLSVGLDLPMKFRYDVTRLPSYPAYEPRPDLPEDIGLQWYYGTPDHFTILFALMATMKHELCIMDSATVSDIKREIQSFQPLQTKSPDPFLMVARLVVQECWRQAAYIYLYMALCNDSSDSARVKEAVEKYARLLRKIKPGRVPDTFLVITLLIAARAARRNKDRVTIQSHLLQVDGWTCTRAKSDDATRVINDYWARTDAESRPVVWSDISISRMRILGV